MFKIKSKRVSKKEFLIELYEGDEVVETYLAKNILDRDKYIFEVSDLHNIVDIEYTNTIVQMTDDINNDATLSNDVKSNKKGKKKVTKSLGVPVIPYTNMFELENYFDSDSEYIFNRILEAVDEGIKLKKKKIKLFQINNSGIYVNSLKRDWPAGLRVAHSYYLQVQKFEKCDICLKLLESLNAKL